MQNQRIFQNKNEALEVTSSRAQRILSEYIPVLREPGSVRPSRSQQHNIWQPLELEMFRLNTDGVCNTKGAVGMGSVLRNSEGQILVCCGNRLFSKCSSIMVEALAIRFGLKEILSPGLTPIQIENEAIQLVTV
ncbi:hypothetical protein Ancab_009025 [Ancistrocladus abbreviatus]